MAAIDWTKPVETSETPPRPVRVLATDIDNSGFPVVVALNYAYRHDAAPLCKAVCYSLGGVAWKEEGPRLRNVAPPKPEPVLFEAWVNLYADGVTGAPCRSCEEVEAMANPGRVECRRIAWMSDGSPVKDEMVVPEEMGGGSWRATAEVAIRDCEDWKRRAESLQADADRARPVVENAVIWERHFSPLAGERLAGSVREYLKGKS